MARSTWVLAFEGFRVSRAIPSANRAVVLSELPVYFRVPKGGIPWGSR